MRVVGYPACPAVSGGNGLLHAVAGRALILMGGDLGTFVDSHAAIVIFGGSAAAPR
jgi:flagellar motor component MotA